jgi:hypothetical protein
MSDQSDFFMRIIVTRFQGFLVGLLSLSGTVHSMYIQASQAIQQVKPSQSVRIDGWQAGKVINQMTKKSQRKKLQRGGNTHSPRGNARFCRRVDVLLSASRWTICFIKAWISPGFDAT